MQRYVPLVFFGAVIFLAPPTQAASASLDASRFFSYENGGGTRSIHRGTWSGGMHASARIDPRIDPRLCRAASIAEGHSGRAKLLCWRYVKQALLEAGAVKSYPKTNYAAEAGDELARNYGFTRLSIRDPYSAPVGAVIVYGTRRYGHVEIRTLDGFVSDYHSKNRCFLPVLAVYGKFSS